MASDDGIKVGFSSSENANSAVDEICEQTLQPDMKITCFFCSSRYDLDAVAARVRKCFPADKVIGCTTAGEIGPHGYSERSMTAFSLGGPGFEATFDGRNSPLDLSLSFIRSNVHRMRCELEERSGRRVTSDNTFGIHLIDSRSQHEEAAIVALSQATGDLAYFGGSAGDDFRFTGGWVYFDGEFRSCAALLALVTTDRPFELFRLQSGVSTGKKLIVTGADPSRRVVTELNCEVAADAYANALGLRREDLCVDVFAAHPLVLSGPRTLYTRGISTVNADGSMRFICAVDNGLVFTLGTDGHTVDDLRFKLEELRRKVGNPSLIICCDGAYRSVAARINGYKETVNNLYRTHNAVGFCCYGEQFGAVHTTHTLVGVAIGDGKPVEAGWASSLLPSTRTPDIR